MKIVLFIISVVVGIIGIALAYLKQVKKKKSSAAIFLLTLISVFLLNVILPAINYFSPKSELPTKKETRDIVTEVIQEKLAPPGPVEKALEQLNYIQINTTRKYVEANLGPPQLEESGELYTRVNYNLQLFILNIVYNEFDEVIQYSVLSSSGDFKPIIDHPYVRECLGCFTFADILEDREITPVTINFSSKDCYYVEVTPGSNATNFESLFLIYSCLGAQYKDSASGFIELYDVVTKLIEGSQLTREEKTFMSDFRKTAVPNSYTVRADGLDQDEEANYGYMLDPFIDWWVFKKL